MALVKKIITVQVSVAIEIDEDLIGAEGVDEPFNLADNICVGLDVLNADGDLFRGATVLSYGADVMGVDEA